MSARRVARVGADSFIPGSQGFAAEFSNRCAHVCRMLTLSLVTPEMFEFYVSVLFLGAEFIHLDKTGFSVVVLKKMPSQRAAFVDGRARGGPLFREGYRNVNMSVLIETNCHATQPMASQGDLWLIIANAYEVGCIRCG